MILYPILIEVSKGEGREMHDTIIIALDKNIDRLPKVDDFTYYPD